MQFQKRRNNWVKSFHSWLACALCCLSTFLSMPMMTTFKRISMIPILLKVWWRNYVILPVVASIWAVPVRWCLLSRLGSKLWLFNVVLGWWSVKTQSMCSSYIAFALYCALWSINQCNLCDRQTLSIPISINKMTLGTCSPSSCFMEILAIRNSDLSPILVLKTRDNSISISELYMTPVKKVRL